MAILTIWGDWSTVPRLLGLLWAGQAPGPARDASETPHSTLSFAATAVALTGYFVLFTGWSPLAPHPTPVSCLQCKEHVWLLPSAPRSRVLLRPWGLLGLSSLASPASAVGWAYSCWGDTGDCCLEATLQTIFIPVIGTHLLFSLTLVNGLWAPDGPFLTWG